jgi:hypothetical protein
MQHMKAIFATLLLMGAAAVAQDSSTAPAAGSESGTPASKLTTVRGCLRGDRGNYIVIENGSTMVYVLKGVGNKLDRMRRHEVEVKGKLLTGSIKTGTRPEKSGSNPSDTVHGIDGIPLQVANVETDIHVISKKCKAADQQ